jgi:Sap, sulfolipid-1-addressing protein
VFTLIKFVLIEVPIISYAINPPRTSARVSRFSNWMAANKLKVTATVVGVIGLVLIVRGIAGLV